ncbi:immunoglobulin-like domain-containing protein [Faecalimicrobium sp. JNUCC 81]
MDAIKNNSRSTIIFTKVPKIQAEDRIIKVGEEFNILEGVLAYDEDNYPVDTNTINIEKNNVDTNKAGIYEVILELSDKTNTFKVQHLINVTVKTNDKPVIIGADDIEISLNQVFDPMYGVIATDTEDGILTDKISINGFLNVCKLGTYILTYSVTDSDSNTTIAERNINVVEIVSNHSENIKNHELATTSVNDECIEKAEDIKENIVIQENIDIIKDISLNEENLNIEANNIEESIKASEKNTIPIEKKKTKKVKKKKKNKQKKENQKKLSRKEKKQIKLEEKRLKKEKKQRSKQNKKELKEEYKKVDKDTFDLLPFLDVAEDETFRTQNGYIDVFQLGTKDLNSLNNDDAQRHMMEFGNFFRSYIDDIKIISMTFPVNTQVQQEHLLKTIDNTDNPIYIQFLNKRLDELIALEEKRKNKEFYLMVFYEDEKTKKERESQLLRLTSSAINLKSLDLDKKLKILFKLNNQNSKV